MAARHCRFFYLKNMTLSICLRAGGETPAGRSISPRVDARKARRRHHGAATVPAPSPGVLAAGDPARAAAGRAIISSLLAGCAFTAYLWGAKELRPLYVHEPWQDDPYDAVVSFAFICVPLLRPMP